MKKLACKQVAEKSYIEAVIFAWKLGVYNCSVFIDECSVYSNRLRDR